MLTKITKYMSRHRRNKWVRRLDSRMVSAHQAIENRNYDFDENGEKRVLSLISQTCGIGTIFDVGANIGEWTQLASQAFPSSKIHSFEPVPVTFQKLSENCRDKKNIQLNNIGLSDSTDDLTIHHSAEADYLATCVSDFVSSFHGIETQPVKITVTSGDLYCQKNDISSIDLLKIDVEGYESNVLSGFSHMLGAGKIKIIQFEYGYINIATKFLLKDFYDLFKPHEMIIGKIYPTYVDFRDYKYEHEDFLGPNYIAVHTSLGPLIKALAD